MQNTYVTLWQNPDGNGNMQARARMVVGQSVYDETVSIPMSFTIEADLAAVITKRIAEIAGGVTDPGLSMVVNSATAEQVITPVSEVTL